METIQIQTLEAQTEKKGKIFFSDLKQTWDLNIVGMYFHFRNNQNIRQYKKYLYERRNQRFTSLKIKVGTFFSKLGLPDRTVPVSKV